MLVCVGNLCHLKDFVEKLEVGCDSFSHGCSRNEKFKGVNNWSCNW